MVETNKTSGEIPEFIKPYKKIEKKTDPVWKTSIKVGTGEYSEEFSFNSKKELQYEVESIDGEGFKRIVALLRGDLYFYLQIKKKDVDEDTKPIVIKEIKLNKEELGLAKQLLNEFKPNKKGREIQYGKERKSMRIRKEEVKEDIHYHLEIGKRYRISPETLIPLREIRLSEKDIKLVKKLFKEVKQEEKPKE